MQTVLRKPAVMRPMPAPQSRQRFSSFGGDDDGDEVEGDVDVDGEGDEGEGNRRCILARKLAEPFRSAREIWG